MNLIDGITKATTEFNAQPGGYVFVNDDNEMFTCNMRPATQDGYWGSNSKGFMTEFLGMYTGDILWKQTLRQI